MKLLRELSIFYFLYFYTYFYFAIDEEFMIFIVIFLWLLFFLVFYLKNLKIFFKDNIMFLIDEYYFFHNKRNFFLSVIRDQYHEIININNFINYFNLTLNVKINNLINKKVINFQKKNNIILLERINLLKLNLKFFLIYNYLTVFSFFYKLLFLLLLSQNNCFNFFFNCLFNLKKNFEFRKNKNTIGSNPLIFYKTFFKKICDNKVTLILSKLFILQQLMLFKLNRLKKNNIVLKKKKKIFKLFKILKLVLKLRNVILVKKIKVKQRKWFYFKKI
jgi:hypothetical protein